MAKSNQKHIDGKALLDEMEKTIPLKVGFCTAHMMLSPGSVVLDAGCANGETTAYFALKNPKAHIIGVDYDGDYIRAAKSKFGSFKNANFIEADLRDFDIGSTPLDASLNLSVHHEFQSFTGYRTQTVVEILQSQLSHTRDYGLIINRDFNKSANPDEMIYLALPDEGEKDGDDYGELSMAHFFLRYSQEAMRSGHEVEPTGHIKGFFAEEHTERLSGQGHDIPDNWRVFAVQEKYAREFIWRMKYRDRFLDEARERYAFWTHAEHRAEPEKLGARVLYSAPYENPWIMENWYKPNVRLFDRNMTTIPLPPSNFISVYQKIPPGESICLREHRTADTAPTYLTIESYKNTHTGIIYDLASRPGGDVVDILPYYNKENRLIIFAKDRYPRPIANIKPRMMSPNLDDKRWSGHMIEPLAAADIGEDIEPAIRNVLTERAGIKPDTLRFDRLHRLRYYSAPAELNERITAVHIEVDNPPTSEQPLFGQNSGFQNDGVFRPFDTDSLLQAAQTGMLAEARLETNIYALMRHRHVAPTGWLGQSVAVKKASDIVPRSVTDLFAAQKQYKVFQQSSKRSGWLDIRRSIFHEIALNDGRQRVVAETELEFIVPSRNISTNSVIIASLVQADDSDEILIGLQKISTDRSQFASVQTRAGHSGLLTLPGFRLPSAVDHIQKVPAWIAQQTGIDEGAIKRLGEGYFPSLGVMPHRVFPYVATEISGHIRKTCDFVPLRSLFEQIDQIEDLHLINIVFRATHALDRWSDYIDKKRK